MTRRKGFLCHPKVSPDGNLTYSIGSLGGPASTASSSELPTIKQLYKKYYPEKPMVSIWEICNRIICRDDIEIEKKELKQIERFIHNNGGVVTNSHRIIKYVIQSLERLLRNFKGSK